MKEAANKSHWRSIVSPFLLFFSGQQLNLVDARANFSPITKNLQWASGETGGGPADMAKLQGGTRQIQVSSGSVTVGGDIVIAFDGTRIRNIDDLSTYLEKHTLPNQTIDVTIIRNGETMTLPLKLGTRPAAP